MIPLRLAVWWHTRPWWVRAALTLAGTLAAFIAAGAVLYLTA